MKDRGKPTEQVDEPPRADSKPGATGDRTRPPELAPTRPKTPRGRAGRETAVTPDGGRLLLAVAVAMLLGVAFGLWLNARLASAAMESQALAAPSRPIINAERAEAAAAESAPVNRVDVSPAVNGPAPTTAAGESDDGKESMSKPPRAPAGNAGGVRGAGGAARPSAGEAETPRETDGRKNAPARAAASPCPLYASAGALNVRGGGEASLVLGGPGRQGRVSVTTPDWADIAVFPEGQAGGGRGWVKYSVRSVSGRAGVFSVRVKGPCGTLTIPVKVVRP
jgi:hypothetical protein